MSVPSSADVVVIGAGLAGLAAARTIQTSGHSVIVVEASDAVGGRVRTDNVDGFLLDRGFQVILTAYPELDTQVDMDALDVQAFDPGAIVWRNGRGHVVSDPFRKPLTLGSTAFAPIGTLLDKVRIVALRARVLRRSSASLLGGQDVSTDVALRTFGFSSRMIDRFFRPLFGGIQLDPHLATSRRMFDVIFRSLSQGQSVVPSRGMEELPRQIASHLSPGSIVLNSRVKELRDTTVVLESGSTITARAIVVATEGPAASKLLGLPAVESRTVGCVYFSADKPPTHKKLVVLDGTGKGPVLNVAVMSNIAPSYAPPGKHLIVAALPGECTGDLVAISREQLRNWWGPQVDAWKHVKTYAIAHGGPVQKPPFAPKQRVNLGNGRFVCGDHRDTGSIQGALFSGRRCGEAVVNWLA
ncbi:MAG: NAD(P)/FAD-dependent oxidoreductase [Ilumatobacteraceae bacterium]|jgi:phytoene dehydrogenase-like protein